jgi:Rrf2 family protein
MFNKETEYALRALVYIQFQNTGGHRPGIVEITREIDAPPSYTAKILQRMVRHGFLQSLKGKGGGFYFEKDQAAVPLKEIIRVIEGDKTFAGCSFGLKQCDSDNPCPLHEQYAPIRESMHQLLTVETIRSMAEKYKQKIEIL